MPDKRCPICKKVFTPSPPQKKICSEKCRHKRNTQRSSLNRMKSQNMEVQATKFSRIVKCMEADYFYSAKQLAQLSGATEKTVVEYLGKMHSYTQHTSTRVDGTKYYGSQHALRIYETPKSK